MDIVQVGAKRTTHSKSLEAAGLSDIVCVGGGGQVGDGGKTRRTKGGRGIGRKRRRGRKAQEREDRKDRGEKKQRGGIQCSAWCRYESGWLAAWTDEQGAGGRTGRGEKREKVVGGGSTPSWSAPAAAVRPGWVALPRLGRPYHGDTTKLIARLSLCFLPLCSRVRTRERGKDIDGDVDRGDKAYGDGDTKREAKRWAKSLGWVASRERCRLGKTRREGGSERGREEP